MTIKTLGAAALIAASATVAHADDWTAYTYSSVSTTSAVKGMQRIVDRVAEDTDLTIDLHLGARRSGHNHQGLNEKLRNGFFFLNIFD